MLYYIEIPNFFYAGFNYDSYEFTKSTIYIMKTKDMKIDDVKDYKIGSWIYQSRGKNALLYEYG